jgi:hypothetical protein
MKKIILTFSVLLFTTILLGQEIRFSFGPTINYTKSKTNNDVIISTAEESIVLIGFDAGLNYFFKSKNDNLRFGFGIGYQANQISVIRSNEGSSDYQLHYDKIELLSVSLKSMMRFKENFYFSLDPILDMQLNYDPEQYLDKQTGLGLSAGLGKDFTIKDNIALNLEPRIWIHNLIPFQDAVPTRLITFGLNLGLSFKNFK